MEILELIRPNVHRMEFTGDVKGLIKTLRYKSLIKTKRYSEEFVRRMAAEALGRIGDTRAVDPLIQALKEDYSVRKEAAEALGKIGDARAVKHLIATLKGYHSGDVIEKVEKALKNIKDPGAVEPFIQALNDENEQVRRIAMEALGEIGDNRAVKPLIGIIEKCEKKDSEESDERDFLYRLAARSLAKIGIVDVRLVKVLIGDLSPYSEDPARALELLVKIGEPAVEPLIQALKHVNDGVRANAAEALGKIGDKRAVEPLIQALWDEKSYLVRGDAAEALGKIGDKRAAEALISYLLQYRDIRHKIDIETIKNIFGNYTVLIVNANSFRVTKSGFFGGRIGDGWDYSLKYSPNFEAIEKLCKIRTQISNNILHQVLSLKDIEVVIGSSNCNGDSYGTLSFEPFRQMAREELERRGNPPYNPSAYLDDESWKL